MHSALLLTKYPLISDQVNKDQLAVILGELEKILQNNREETGVTEVPGAIVEFGCYIGTTSLFIRRLLDTYKSDREFHVYDSFVGLPAKSAADGSGAGSQFVAGELAASKKQLLREFQKAHRRPPHIHKAWFSELPATAVPPHIAFAFLDGDFYESIRDSLKLVLARASAGATIIFDDYAREALPGVEKAARELLTPSQYQAIRVSHNLGILRT